MALTWFYLPADAAERRLNAGNREVDAAPGGVTPLLHGQIGTVYGRLEKTQVIFLFYKFMQEVNINKTVYCLPGNNGGKSHIY